MPPAAPPYAVLFKTHFWDDFVESQFRHLQSRAGTDQVFVIVDETHGPITGITHDKVLRLTEETSEAEGFYQYPKGNSFWYNTDYPLYHFIGKYPNFKYVVASEYDVAVNVDLLPIILTMETERLELVCERIVEGQKPWVWKKTAKPYYPDDLDIVGRLCCISILSLDFINVLQIARKEHLRRLKAHEWKLPNEDRLIWPFAEAFIGAEIERLAWDNRPFSAFANMSNFDWWPPYHPNQINKSTRDAICHPVLAGDRLVRSLMKYPDLLPPELWLEPASELRTRLDFEAPEIVIPALLEAFLKRRNSDAISFLWTELKHLGLSDQIFPLSETLSRIRKLGLRTNIALGKFASQSSVCRWSHSKIPYEDAANAVNGCINGDYAFHTKQEFRPWWTVDLGSIALVSEIVVFNQVPDHLGRANNLSIWTSLEARTWTLLHKRSSSKAIGGIDGNPMKIVLSESCPARFVRIEIYGIGILHLNEVQVFGKEITEEGHESDI